MSRVMVDDSRRDAVFRKLRLKPGNKHCFDCNSRNPSWATPTYGVFVCLNCSASHRRMGVHISFMRSCELDSWSEGQLQRMVAGGNEAAKNFFAKKGWRGQMSKIEEKYHSRAAQLYKAHLDRVASSAKIPNSPERAPKQEPVLTSFQALALSAQRQSDSAPGLHTRSSSTPGRVAHTPTATGALAATSPSAVASPKPLMSTFVSVHKKPSAVAAAAPPPPAPAAAAPAPAAASAPSTPTPAAAPAPPTATASSGSKLSMGALGAKPAASKPAMGGLRGGLGGRRTGGLGGRPSSGGLNMGGLRGGLRKGGLGGAKRAGGLTGGLGARKLGGKQTLGASRLAPTRATANPDAVLGSFEDAERAAAAEAAAAAKRQEDEDFAIAVALAEQDANVAMARSLSVASPARTAAPAPRSSPGSGSRRAELMSGRFANATAISSDMLSGDKPATQGRGRARTSSSDLAEFVGSIGGQVAADLGKAASKLGGIFGKGSARLQ